MLLIDRRQDRMRRYLRAMVDQMASTFPENSAERLADSPAGAEYRFRQHRQCRYGRLYAQGPDPVLRRYPGAERRCPERQYRARGRYSTSARDVDAGIPCRQPDRAGPVSRTDRVAARNSPSSESSLGNVVSQMRDGFARLMDTPNSIPLQNEVVSLADNFARTINRLAEGINTIRTKVQGEIEGSIDDINTQLKAIDDLNEDPTSTHDLTRTRSGGQADEARGLVSRADRPQRHEARRRVRSAYSTITPTPAGGQLQAPVDRHDHRSARRIAFRARSRSAWAIRCRQGCHRPIDRGAAWALWSNCGTRSCRTSRLSSTNFRRPCPRRSKPQA